jgi:hypothetical protein
MIGSSFTPTTKDTSPPRRDLLWLGAAALVALIGFAVWFRSQSARAPSMPAADSTIRGGAR